MKYGEFLLTAMLLVMWQANAAAQTAQDISTSKQNTKSVKESDIAVGIGNGKVTTFNKFLKEHWNDVNISDPEILEKQALRRKVMERREAKYGAYITPGNGRRRAPSKSGIGKSSVNKGNGYKPRRRHYDAERDKALTEDAIRRAAESHKFTEDLYNRAMGVINNDGNYKASVDGKEMARQNRDAYEDKSKTDRQEPKVNPTDGLIDFNKPIFDYEELLRRFNDDPDSLSKEEYDFLVEHMDEEISRMGDKELEEIENKIKNNEQKK